MCVFSVFFFNVDCFLFVYYHFLLCCRDKTWNPRFACNFFAIVISCKYYFCFFSRYLVKTNNSVSTDSFTRKCEDNTFRLSYQNTHSWTIQATAHNTTLTFYIILRFLLLQLTFVFVFHFFYHFVYLIVKLFINISLYV